MRSASENPVRSSGCDCVPVIMAKAPNPGLVKTRLAPSLCLDAILAFYGWLLHYTLALARSLDDVDAAIICPGGDVNDLARLAAELRQAPERAPRTGAGLKEWERVAVQLRASAGEL
jgi:hypothetical protein